MEYKKYYTAVRRTVFLLNILFLCLTAGASKREVMFLDLHELTRTSLNDSIRLLDMWDALHCASTLQ